MNYSVLLFWIGLGIATLFSCSSQTNFQNDINDPLSSQIKELQTPEQHKAYLEAIFEADQGIRNDDLVGKPTGKLMDASNLEVIRPFTQSFIVLREG